MELQQRASPPARSSPAREERSAFLPAQAARGERHAPRSAPPALFTGLAAALTLAGCQPPDSPEGRGGGSGTDAGYSQRHQDFSRGSVHLLGALEGVRFAEGHQLEEVRGKFLEAAVEAAGELLDRHEGFPPHPSALDDPDKIARWQDAMALARAAARAIAESGGGGGSAPEVDRLLESYREAGRQSGYPGGTVALLEWRGVHKMARDLDPAVRLRFADDLVERLERGRDRFVAERRPLVPEEDLPGFDRRVRTLLDEQVDSIRKPGPIPDSTAAALHEHYPVFHHPDVLARLLEREREHRPGANSDQ